ncbi:MAG: DUF5063 domain-containing protein [Muribaculaceae bacterium]
MENSSKLSTNSIAFIALANEYCNEIETTREIERETFIFSLLKLLPRLYISATDLLKGDSDSSTFIDSYLDEDYYESIRRNMETLMGPDDVYLEVFEDDMKYSDTPIAASISECLADIYQDLYNFISSVKEAPIDDTQDILYLCKDNFEAYWGQKLCNVLRALNSLHYNND